MVHGTHHVTLVSLGLGRWCNEGGGGRSKQQASKVTWAWQVVYRGGCASGLDAGLFYNGFISAHMDVAADYRAWRCANIAAQRAAATGAAAAGPFSFCRFPFVLDSEVRWTCGGACLKGKVCCRDWLMGM